ncbi:hypothetical protein [Nostoc sp.]|uniref:hypothetical protein n=1 Tax=Nostoc sp. TaxID=1180 RepID=UPI0035931DE1
MPVYGKVGQECILGIVAYLLKHHNINQWIKTWVKNKAVSANGYATSMSTARQGAKDECITAVALFATQGF